MTRFVSHISTTSSHIASRLARTILSCVLAVCLTLSFTASAGLSSAYGDIRKTDIISGTTIESRSLSASVCPSIDAEYALVMDSEGTIYFERNATTATQIASITKVMTAIVALESVPLDTTVTVSYQAASTEGSTASFWTGDTMTLATALEGMLVVSGNDAATAVAETVGAYLLTGTAGVDAAGVSRDEALAAFVARMNERAEELGCIDTYFENPHGLDSGAYAGDQHSCAYDVALMVKEAMTNETFRSIVASESVTLEVTRASGSTVQISLNTTNRMFSNGFDGACGVKTGMTNLAGYCFAGAAQRDGKEFYAIVLNSTSGSQRAIDAQTLLDWAFNHTQDYQLVNTSESTSDGQPILAEIAHADWIDVTVPATVADPDQSITVFNLGGNVSQSVEFYELSGDISAGDVIGTITFKQRNEVVATLDLIAAENVSAPDFFERIGVWWSRLIRSMSGQSTVAESVLYNETPLIFDKTGS